MALIQTALPATSQPWETAKSRFLQGLSESERSMFISATLENLFYQSSGTFERYRVDSSLWKLQVKIQPLLDAVQEFGAAIDIYANASPTVLCPLWGSIRVVLSLARGFGKYFEKLVDMFSRISAVLPRYRVYESLFPDHERLLAALTKSYLDIIIFCVDAKELFGKARRSAITWAVFGNVLWKNFDQKFSNVNLPQFLRHQKLVEKEASLSEMIEAKNSRTLVQANQLAQANSRRDMKRRQLLSALSTVDYAAQHRRLRHLRHTGTCNWLLRDVGFRSWLHAQSSSCFACYGIPGSGKTVLSASIAEELSPILSEPQFGMCYYYCDYSNVKSLDAPTVVGTLIRQLLEKIDIPEDVESHISSLYNGSSVGPALHDLLDVFERSLALFSTCLIVIDGLDELPRESQFTIVGAIKSLLSSDKTLIKALVSSRSEENDIRRALRGPQFHSIEISTDNISSDIRAFINDEVDARIKQGRLMLGSPSVRDEILQALTVGAKDMFLWVKFQLDDLCGATSDKEIRETLRDLPKDLTETYGRIITKIRASGPGRIRTARKMFKWILCAQRPLRIEELREAVALDLTDSHFDEDKLPSGDNWRLIQMCGNLAILNRDDNTVKLAHHTVQQFLLTQSDFLSADNSIPVRLSLPDIKLEIGQLCVAYLCLSDFETQVSKREMVTVAAGTDVLQSFVYSQMPVTSVLSKFASTIISAGWTESPVERRPVVVDLSTYRPEQHFSRSMHDKYRLLDYIQHNWTRHATALTSLASSWDKLQDLIFERSFMFDIRPWDIDIYKQGGTISQLPYLPMFRWAIDEGLIMYVRLLGDPRTGSTVWDYYTHEATKGIDPLVRAAKSGHVHSLAYLMSLLKLNYHFAEDHCEVILEMAKHASPSILDQIQIWINRSKSKDYVLKYLSARFWSVCQDGRTQDAVALVHLGVNINIRAKDVSQRLKSPLEVATAGSHTEIVTLLQQHNPDPISRLRSMEFAVINKMDNLIFLLQSGFDPRILAETFFESLAVSNAAMCKRLIDLGADVNFHPPGRDPSLFIAIRSHSTENVDMLLNDTRLDICALDANANTFLHHAAYSEYDLEQNRAVLSPHMTQWPDLLHARNLSGYSALHTAIRTNFKPAFQFLAEFNNNEHELLEALEMSLDHGAAELVEWLFAFKKDLLPPELEIMYAEHGISGATAYFMTLQTETAEYDVSRLWQEFCLPADAAEKERVP